MTPDPYAADYRGEAVLALGDEKVAVTVTLSGHLEPIDGKYHWYGRIAADQRVAELKRQAARGQVTIAVPGGEPVAAKLAELDPVGNVRVTGVGEPPYPLETLEEIDGSFRADR